MYAGRSRGLTPGGVPPAEGSRHGRAEQPLGGRLTRAVRENLPRVVGSAKVADLAAVPTYLAAGLARVSFRRFLAWVATFSLIRAALLIGVGVLVGHRAAGLFASPGTALAAAAALALAVMFVNLFVRRAAGRRHPRKS